MASDEMQHMVSHASIRHFQIDTAAMAPSVLYFEKTSMVCCKQWAEGSTLCEFNMILGPLADA